MSTLICSFKLKVSMNGWICLNCIKCKVNEKYTGTNQVWDSFLQLPWPLRSRSQ